MHGLRPKIHLKSPLAPPPVPQNSIQCHLLRAHSPRIYIRSLLKFPCLYLRACAFGKWWGAPFENARVGAKNPLQITIRTPPASYKPAQTPLCRGHFSTNMHLIIPNFALRIAQGICCQKGRVLDSKMYGYRLEKRLNSPLAHRTVPFKLHSMPPSKGPFSPNIHPIIPKLSVPIPQGMCFRKKVGTPFEKARIEAKNPSEITLSTPAGTPEFDSMPPSKGPFSANIHPIIPKLFVPIPQGMCFRKMVGGPLRKCTDWGQKSIWNHP